MNSYNNMTWRLALLTFVTLGAAFAVISLVLDRYQERELDAALLEVAQSEAVEAPTNHFSFSSGPGPAANDVGPLDKYGIIFDDRGAPLSATQPFDVSTPTLASFAAARAKPFDFTFSSRRFRGVIVPIPGFEERMLLLAASREDLDGDSRFLRQAMSIALAIAVAWLIGAIRWLVRWTMRDHERIAEMLHRIASGDVDARVSGVVADKDLRKLGTDIDEIASRLAQLIEHQRRFIAHAAHELRSPLAALHGEIQQALRKERSGEDYRRSLTFLLTASARLKHLADELLELARADAKTEVPATVDVQPAIRDVVESIQPLAREKSLTFEIDPTSARVFADARALERIIRNLVDNAVRHSPRNGIVRLNVSAGSTVTISVSDDGPGVAPEDRDRIFEPFHRSPALRRDANGAGLGLAIARQLARNYNGDVRLEGWNRFQVRLPAANS